MPRSRPADHLSQVGGPQADGALSRHLENRAAVPTTRIAHLVLVALLAGSGVVVAAPAEAAGGCRTTKATVTIPLVRGKHAQVIDHARAAVRSGFPVVLVLHRDGADARRRAATKGVATRAGYDRDEYPPAAGRKVNKAHVKLVDSSQNRSAGAVLGNTLRRYCNGTKFRYALPASPGAGTKPPASVSFANCTAVRQAGAAPIHIGQPGYGRHLDRDGDGVACE